MPPPQALNGNIADLIAERHGQQQPALPAHAFKDFMLSVLGGWSGIGTHKLPHYSSRIPPLCREKILRPQPLHVNQNTPPGAEQQVLQGK
jgi:hypothetical protein